MRSKMVIGKINDMKIKLGSKVKLKKTGKTKVESELSAKAGVKKNWKDESGF